MTTMLKDRPSAKGATDPRFDLAPSGTSDGRRHLPEVAAGALVVLVFALGVLWWQASSTDQEPVLAMRNAVERGQTVTIDDLQIVNIATSDSLAVLTEAQAGLVIGRVARTDLAAGTLIGAEQFSDGSLLADGEGVVGLSLQPGQVPSLSLSPGDVVSVVRTPTAGDPRAFDDDSIAAAVLVERATVVEVSPIGVQGHVFVALQVGEPDAARVAVAASADRVRLIQVGEGS